MQRPMTDRVVYTINEEQYKNNIQLAIDVCDKIINVGSQGIEENSGKMSVVHARELFGKIVAFRMMLQNAYSDVCSKDIDQNHIEQTKKVAREVYKINKEIDCDRRIRLFNNAYDEWYRTTIVATGDLAYEEESYIGHNWNWLIKRYKDLPIEVRYTDDIASKWNQAHSWYNKKFGWEE